VTKDPIGHKGARLTSQISLPGRFLVLVPNGGMTGISRKLPDTERHRLKAILTNCARLGPASQNHEGHPDFAAHLQGKLAWVNFIHPGKGAKLRAIFEKIDWTIPV
jgi:hypothetical protein